MKPYILLSNGRQYWFHDPDPDCFDIEVIAGALANSCRFSGHVRRFYSVAEHCHRASYLVPEEFALEALLHDAAEAFVIDVPSPLKPLLPEYKGIEEKGHRVVAEKYGLTYPWPEEVLFADRCMLAWEARDLMPPDPDGVWEYIADIEPPAAVLSDGTKTDWKIRFMRRFDELVAKRKEGSEVERFRKAVLDAIGVDYPGLARRVRDMAVPK